MTELDGLIALMLVTALLFICSSCATVEHKKEVLQKEFPECTITSDFDVICPIPDFHH